MKKKLIIGAAIGLVILLIGGFVYFKPEKDPLASYVFETVAVQDLTQTVSVTGMIVPASDVTLAFETGGRVGYVLGGVGTRVYKGMVLASLVSSDVASDLAQAQAAVVSAQATLKQQEAGVEAQEVKLKELEKGARPEEIQIQETALTIAQSDLSQLQSSQSSLLMNAQIQADDAVNRLTDDFFTNDQSAVPQFRFQTSSSIGSGFLEGQRVQIQSILDMFSLTQLSEAKVQLSQIKSYLSFLTTAFDQVIGYADGTTVSSTTIETNKASLKTALTNIQTSIDTLSDREDAIASQTLVVEKIKQELALKKAPATQEQLAAQQAAIKQAQALVEVQKANIAQAQAKVQSIQAQFSKKSIVAPFSGIISKQDAKVGEIVGASTPVVSLISDSAYEIEAHIPEVDVGLIQVGQPAEVHLDAYPTDVFLARVIQLDPAETIIEGVSTYRIVLEFETTDDRLKSGMSVDLDIVTNKKSGVLSVSSRAIITRDQQTYVRVKIGTLVLERDVQVGIRANGRTEIISGLEEGEEVVVREIN